MREIELLMHHVEDELKDAHTYARMALEYKTTDPETAELFYRLSGEEMNHMNALHKDVVRRIDDYRRKNGEPSEAMTAVYEYLHKKMIGQAEEVGVLQAMFKK